MTRTKDVHAETGENPVACRGCAKQIFWGTTDEGKKIPLDPVPAVYVLETGGRCRRVKSALVTHFATCKDAAAMRKG